MNGQGWPFKGRPGQDDPSNWYHQVTRNEGSRKATICLGCTFFSLVFFMQVKKSNSLKAPQGRSETALSTKLQRKEK